MLLEISFSRALHRLPEQFFAKLMGRAMALAEQGRDIINLGQGNPDRPTPAHIVDALCEAARNPSNHRYSPFRGYLHLKEAVAQFYEREYGVSLDPQREVAILIGGKSGLVEISQCLLNEGDVVLVPDPGYPDYWSGIAMAGAKMHMMPLLAENGFLPDYTKLDPQSLERAKLMFLNYPNNPTAGVATEAFFAETVAFANKNRIPVVHDFAYGAIGFDGVKPPSFLQAAGAKEVGIEIYTMSKTYNMAGWRIAFAVGHEQMIESINLWQDHFHCSVFGAVQDAAAHALLAPQDEVEQLVATYESRRNVLIGGLRDLGYAVDAPKGSFFTWIPVPDTYTAHSFSECLLEQASIIVAPGTGFGEHGEGYVRVALLADEARLQEAVQRIASLNLFR